MMNVPILIEAITSEVALKQDDQWWSIYHSSFPIAEQEPAAAILNCLNKKAGMSLRVRDEESGDTIGIAHGQFLNALPSFMLIYIAIDKPYRGQQIGNKLLRYIEEKINAHYSHQTHFGVVFEVDRPENFSIAQHQLLAERRISFYQKLGYEVEKIDYHQPPLSLHESVPMYLMTKTRSLTTENKQALVKAIYFEKYSELNGISAVNHEMIEQMWQQAKKLNGWV